jgi:hypothetical protein
MKSVLLAIAGAMLLAIGQSSFLDVKILDVTGGACHEQCYFKSPTGCAGSRAPQG